MSSPDLAPSSRSRYREVVRRLWPSIAVAICAACTDDGPIILTTEGLAALVLVDTSGATLAAEAFAVDDETAIARAAPAAGSLYVVGYAATLEALRLARGPLPLSPTGAPLPPGDRFHRWGVDAWESLEGPPELLKQLHIAQPDPCFGFELESRSVPLESGEAARFAVEIDGSSVLFGTDHGRMFRVTADALEPLTAPSTTAPTLAAYRAADGELWLLGADRRVLRGRIGGVWTDAPPVPLDPSAGLVVDGPPSASASPLELFAADNNLSVARFDGARWSVVRAGAPRPASAYLRPQIAWAEPGLAVLTGVGTSSVVEVSTSGGGRAIPIELPPRSSNNAPWGVRYVEGRGVVLGTLYDELYLRAGGAYTQLPPPPVTPRADVIVDLGDGAVLAGGQNGDFIQLRAQDTFCDPVRLMTGLQADGAARLGEGFVLLTSSRQDVLVVTTVTLLR